MESYQSNKIHHLDLFSGIGGFALGLQMADKDFYQTIGFCEINAYCAEVLEKNFSGIPICRDIRELKTKGMQVDLITAGFPCQDLSITGKKAGLKGERSGLFYETIKIAKDTNANLSFLKIPHNLSQMRNTKKVLLKKFKRQGMVYAGECVVVESLDTHTKEKEFMPSASMLLPTPIASDSFCLKHFTISTQLKAH